MGKRVAFTKPGEVGEFKLGGSFADYTTGDVAMLIPIPDGVSFEDAAAWVVNPWTAVGMVERCRQLKCKSIIVTAAASQIGRMIIKLCK